MMTKINYQPWLQAVLTIAKHYRIEPSEERIRLQLDWNQNQNLDDVLQLMTRQVGLHLRKVPFSLDLLNPWRLPVMVEFNDGQVGVIDKADTQGNVSIQFSGDHGLSQNLSLDVLKQQLRISTSCVLKRLFPMRVLTNISNHTKQAGSGRLF